MYSNQRCLLTLLVVDGRRWKWYIFPKKNDFHLRFVCLFRNEPRKEVSFGSPKTTENLTWLPGNDDSTTLRSPEAWSPTSVRLRPKRRFRLWEEHQRGNWATGKKHENPSLGFIGLFHSKGWNTSRSYLKDHFILIGQYRKRRNQNQAGCYYAAANSLDKMLVDDLLVWEKFSRHCDWDVFLY